MSNCAAKNYISLDQIYEINSEIPGFEESWFLIDEPLPFSLYTAQLNTAIKTPMITANETEIEAKINTVRRFQFDKSHLSRIYDV